MDNNRKTFLPMKNLLVITLLFLVGCSQNFKYVLDCEMSETKLKTNSEIVGNAKISFNDTKVGSSVFYNLIEFKIVESPNENEVEYPYFFAEKIFNNGSNRHYLKINSRRLNILSMFFSKRNGDWVENIRYFSYCKLR